MVFFFKQQQKKTLDVPAKSELSFQNTSNF